MKNSACGGIYTPDNIILTLGCSCSCPLIVRAAFNKRSIKKSGKKTNATISINIINELKTPTKEELTEMVVDGINKNISGARDMILGRG